MTTLRLLLNSLTFYWRTHLAVLLGVAAGAAVIGGALVVGDSVQASLRQMTLKRLGDVDYAISGSQFFTEELATRLQDRLTIDTPRPDIAPALAMRGGLTHRINETVSRAGGVNVFGLDERLWSMLDHGHVELPSAGDVVLNRRVAEALGAKVGDQIALNIEVPSAIPRESLLGERNDLSRELPLRVAAVLDDELGAARFGLNPGQQIPPVAFVALDDLQSTLGLAATRPSRRNPIAKPARVNSLFVSLGGGSNVVEAASRAEHLTNVMRSALTIDDLGLRVVPVGERGYVSLESTRMILDSETVEAAREAAEHEELATSPVYVYLVNEIANAADPQKHSAYSVLAGLDLSEAPPFGPFTFIAGKASAGRQPAENEQDSSRGNVRGADASRSSGIVLNEFLASEQLNVSVGDEVQIRYFEVGSHGELPEKTDTFRVSGIVKLDDIAADPHLTPTLEGITDADTFSDWDQPFEMDMSRITGDDEIYWDEHRATPKAFLPLAEMQRRFPSRYGMLTSFRVAMPAGSDDAEHFAERYGAAVVAAVDLPAVGLAFQPVKAQGLQASAGTTDFTQLFVAFSFFLILSAAILIGLLFRLGVERRAASIGLVYAIGYTRAKVRRLYLAEGLIVVLIGAAVGTVAALGYAALMIHGLTTWWIGAIGTRFLFLSAQPLSLVIGFVSAVAIAMLAVWWGLRRLRNVTARALLAGATEPEWTLLRHRRRGRIALFVSVASAIIAMALVVGGLLGVIPNVEAFGGFSWQVVTFFLAGTLLLVAALTGLSVWLGREHAGAVRSAIGLGVRNAERQRLRSVSTVGLIASATFVLVAVAASQRNPSAELPQKDSGNGGFLLVGESTTALPYSIDTQEGRMKLGVNVESGSLEALLDEMNAVSFRLRPGDDASCLNLYRTGLPTILGVPQTLVERGGFKFTMTQGDKPWQNIAQPKQIENGVPVYPIFGDANTLMYSLKKGIGDRIYVPDEEHPRYALQVAGMLDGSVFQGVLMMSEKNFIEIYPDIDGYGYFLIEGPVEKEAELSNLLETQLTPYGFDAEPVADRIADFLAVQNTYLSTFQALGGLGLILGTFGLGTVMLRNVLERRSELALLRAVGFKTAKLAMLVLIENALLLLWGLAAGTVAALLAVAPHLSSRGADVPVGPGLAMLTGVAVVGMLASLVAVRAAVSTPIVSTLRGE